MSDIKVVYKGEEIYFFEHGDEWRWSDYRNASLGKVKAYIDRAIKVDIEGVTALNRGDYRESYPRVTITSVTEHGEFWIRNGKGRREKLKAKDLIADTPKAAEIVAKIVALEAQRDAVREEIQTLQRTLPAFKLPSKASKAAA